MGMRHRLRAAAESAVATVPFLHDLAVKLRSRQAIFSQAYASKAWGSDESGSGIGSELGATHQLREFLPDLLHHYGIKKFLDAPCGDWNWMQLVDLQGVQYVGVDVVPEVVARNRRAYQRKGVSFMVADLTRDELPRADLILCRDCWIHLSFRDVALTLENFRRTGATWLLVSNSPRSRMNKNQLTGRMWRHLNLHMPPFNFPASVEVRADHYDHTDFEITLWKLADLPRVEP